MKLREIDHGLTLAAPSEGYERTPGLHASDIYGSFYKSLDPSRYDKRNTDGDPLPMDDLKMEVGTSFEEVLETAIARRLLGERPGEFTSPEGVIYSPDHLFFNGETVLGEFKLTWYSSKGAPTDPKFDKWWTQIKLYLHWLQMTKVRLYVLFVNDNYKPPTPKLKVWEAEFSVEELAEEHATLMRHARRKGMLI